MRVLESYTLALYWSILHQTKICINSMCTIPAHARLISTFQSLHFATVNILLAGSHNRNEGAGFGMTSLERHRSHKSVRRKLENAI